MSLEEDGSSSLMRIARFNNKKIIKLENHISAVEQRLSRVEKLLIAAIATNLPQLIQILINLI